MTTSYLLKQGTLPLLISMPHAGTEIPTELQHRFTDVAQHLDDTDWHMPRLYQFAEAMGASILVPRCSRYVIDLNRPPDNANLYPGQDTTGLCPVDTFAKVPLYRDGDQPQADEIAERVERYWQPYHQAIQQELSRLKTLHGHALLWDAHSILSRVPRFFEGQLPDFNLGSGGGTACAPGVGEQLLKIASQHTAYTAVLNGRFKGGYITRQYGQPHQHIQAMQLELSQRTYMNEQRPYDYAEELAGQVQPVIRALLEGFVRHAA